MKSKLYVFLIALTAIALSSCATVRTYSGDPRPKNEIAILKGAWNEYFFTSVTGHVKSVDGQDIKSADTVEVLPGEHQVSVYLRKRSFGGIFLRGKPVRFTLMAKPGHVYLVDGNWNWGNNQLWIEDTTTGEIVAGKRPD